ncbi:MAG: aspartate kinase [Chitinophagales bacterium]|nr:aspartate kinase [Chitinophagales bacterium]MCZ2394860.1 aspartate kinase [Chitinophagales bacterium]
MKVFKFGGASVKDAAGVKNVADIIKRFGDEKILIVVSATGKTTNALEEVVNAYLKNTDELQDKIKVIKDNHYNICKGLFSDESHAVYQQLNDIFYDLEKFVSKDRPDSNSYVYDQIVSVGEMISSVILSQYLNYAGVKNSWLDVCKVLKTDDTYREAIINWEDSTQKTNEILRPLLEKNTVVTQGFIGSTVEGFTTTLGREGSDYTAAIFANILDAENQTIWKDVPGVMSGDPRRFQDAVFIDELSYLEAVEMTYYGASVIHPKTIKPIQNKNIPLLVKSFINPEGKGTKVFGAEYPIQYPPVRVIKDNQTLLTFHSIDFSFVADDTVGDLLKAFALANLKINMMQTGAISLQAVVDNSPEKIEKVIKLVKNIFNIHQENDLVILTIRHYNNDVIQKHIADKQVIISQKRPSTYQVLYMK